MTLKYFHIRFKLGKKLLYMKSANYINFVIILTDYEQDITLFISHGEPVKGKKNEINKNKGNTFNDTFYLRFIDIKSQTVFGLFQNFVSCFRD